MATPPPPAVVAEMRIALALAASASAARWPFTSDPLDFWAGGGKLFVSSGAASARLHLKGVSWFGFETSTACVHELWAHSLDAYLNFLVTHEFNAIRLPLAIDNVLNNPGLSHWECRTGGRSLDFLETVVSKASQRGILVMLDMHRTRADVWPTDHGLWCDVGADEPMACTDENEQSLWDAWTTIATRFCDQPNVFAADLFNEPHGARRRGTRASSQPVASRGARAVANA